MWYNIYNERARPKQEKEAKKMTFIEVLNNPEARELIDLIEELIGETEAELVRIRNEYINRLAEQFGYTYKI